MEKTITIVLILFMLSLITEKLSNFIKLRFKSLNIKWHSNSEQEKSRERKISIIAVTTGIIVAVSSHADFFELVQHAQIKPWEEATELTWLSLFGCLITGIFLSQGSKFFHDLLDVLLYAKNIKRALYNNKEIINEKLKSEEFHNASSLFSAVVADDREDEPDNNL